MRLILLGSSLAFVCAAASFAGGVGHGGNESGGTKCYASSQGWRAWIDSRADGGRELVVTGVVTTPTGGHHISLTPGPVIETDPPQQVVDLQIKATGDIATLAVVTEEVRARFPALPRYGAVIIRCNGNEIGRISQVE